MPAPMLAGQPPRDHRGERHVLCEVAGEADEAAVDRQADDPHRAVPLLGRLAGLAEADDVDVVAGVDEGVALTANPGVPGEDGVDDDRDARPTAHRALTSSQSRSFSASVRLARSTPRSAANASTRR